MLSDSERELLNVITEDGTLQSLAEKPKNEQFSHNGIVA